MFPFTRQSLADITGVDPSRRPLPDDRSQEEIAAVLSLLAEHQITDAQAVPVLLRAAVELVARCLKLDGSHSIHAKMRKDLESLIRNDVAEFVMAANVFCSMIARP